MRKILSSLLLMLSLLVSQQGAVVHELGHLGEATRTTSSKDSKAHPPCETCLAFAHIVGVVHSGLVAPTLLATADHWVAAEVFRPRDADAPAYAARDPPLAS